MLILFVSFSGVCVPQHARFCCSEGYTFCPFLIHCMPNLYLEAEKLLQRVEEAQTPVSLDTDPGTGRWLALMRPGESGRGAVCLSRQPSGRLVCCCLFAWTLSCFPSSLVSKPRRSAEAQLIVGVRVGAWGGGQRPSVLPPKGLLCSLRKRERERWKVGGAARSLLMHIDFASPWHGRQPGDGEEGGEEAIPKKNLRRRRYSS